MHLLPKITLLLSSLVFFISSCKISKYNRLHCTNVVLSESNISPVIHSTNVLKYTASIDVLKNHLTGLIIIKQTDSITKHIVFVTELGMKMFDLEIKNNDISVVYVFEPLNKPQLVEAIKRNFSNMLLLNIYGNRASMCEARDGIIYGLTNKKTKKFYSGVSKQSNSNLIERQETFYKGKQESRINYIYNSSNQTYSQITCKQYGLVKFYFELNQIPQTND